MPIPINLKQILQSDTQQEKLDKVNYNFDQLVANGGGPMGATGSIGETGFQGATGDDGPQGIDGPQGFQGPADASNNSKWKDGAVWYNGVLSIKTITPIHELDDNNPATQSNFPPTSVLLGYANNDDEYGNVASISAYLDSVLLINKNSNYHDSNIRLVSEKETDKYLDIALTNYPAVTSIGDQSVLEFKFASSVAAGEYRWNADRYIINDVNDNEMMSMDATDGVKFTGSFLSTNDAIFTGSIFKINNGTGTQATDPDVDKIAVSLDNTGTIGFKTASEIGASVPIGTIVSFHYDTYIDISNFTQTQQIDLTQLPEDIDIVVGRGIAGTQYEGWYLCNGQTWKNDNNNIQYTVPNLNSFSFDFTSGGTQIISAPGASTPNFLGGGEFEFQQNGNLISHTIDVNSTEAWVSETSTNSNYATTDYAVVKTPQIIYLGHSDLYYNVSAPPPIPQFFEMETTLAPAGGIQANVSALSAAYKKRISSYGINGDNGSVFYSNPSIDLEYNKPALIYIKVTGKSYIPYSQNQLQVNLPTTGKYSWFVNWNERMYFDSNEPDNFNTGTWNDRGNYSPNATYTQGDVFFWTDAYGAGYWLTLAKGVSQFREVDQQNLSSSWSVGQGITNSSWDRVNHIEGVYFYQLPYNNQSNNSLTYRYNDGDGQGNVWQPTSFSSDLDLPGKDDMTNIGLEGAFFPGVTNSIGFNPSNPFYDDETNNHIFPPNKTFDTGDSLNSFKGMYTQPMQVLLEPEDNGSSDPYLVVPVVNSYNISEIQSLYPQLNVTNSHLVQYTQPHGYTDTDQYWDETNYLDYDVAPGVNKIKHLNGNYTIDGNNDPTSWNSVHSWRPNQLDTDFRRYKSVVMTVLLEPDVVNKILDNTDPSIKIGLGQWEDDNTGTFTFYPSNFQPLGNDNAPAVIEENVGNGGLVLAQNTLTTSLGTGTDFTISDYSGGAGSGNDTVPYNISPNSAAPVLRSGSWNSYFTANVGTPDSNGDGIITLQSIMSCISGLSMSNSESFTIEHPTDSNISVQYDGYYNRATCINSATVSFLAPGGGNMSRTSVTFDEGSSGTIYGTITASAPWTLDSSNLPPGHGISFSSSSGYAGTDMPFNVIFNGAYSGDDTQYDMYIKMNGVTVSTFTVEVAVV